MVVGLGREQAIATGPESWPAWPLDATDSLEIYSEVDDRVYWDRLVFVDWHQCVDMDVAGCSQGPPLHV